MLFDNIIINVTALIVLALRRNKNDQLYTQSFFSQRYVYLLIVIHSNVLQKKKKNQKIQFSRSFVLEYYRFNVGKNSLLPFAIDICILYKYSR